MTEVAEVPALRQPSVLLTWAPRVALAVAFVYLGAVKLPDEPGLWVRLFERIGVGQWFRSVTALVEIVGGMLMLVPRATMVAVVLLASTMVGALGVHAMVTGFGLQTLVVSVLLALTLAVGASYRRHR